jgi:hypothetical protein
VLKVLEVLGVLVLRVLKVLRGLVLTVLKVLGLQAPRVEGTNSARQPAVQH